MTAPLALRWRRVLARCTGTLAVLAATALSAHAQGTAPGPAGGPAEGTLQVVWGDPREALTGARPDARPVHRFFLERPGAPPLEVGLGAAPLAGTSPVLLGGRAVRLELGPAAGRQAAPVRAAALRDPALAPPGLRAPASRAPGLRASVGAAVLSRPVAVILCQFPDTTVATWKTREQYERDWTGPAPSVGAWYTEVSRDAVSLAGTRAFGPYRMPRPRSAYVVDNRANLNELADDCAGAADADVNFPDYWGVALHFSAPLDCCSYGGGRRLTYDGQARTYGFNWNASWAGVSTSVHELGHSLGLPHSSSAYGRVYDSAWDVMSGGGLTHFVGWGKQRLDFVPGDRQVVVRGEARTVRVGRSAQPLGDGSALTVELPLPTGPGHAYVVEARQRVGFDASVPAPGVVISRVNPTRAEPSQVVDGDGNGNVNDAGAVWTPGERFSDDAFGVEIAVVSADATGYTLAVRNGAGGGLLVDAASRPATLPVGGVAADSARVRVAAGATGWIARTRAGWLQLVTAAGSAGEGWLRWRLNAAGLPPGTYVDTLRVSAVGRPAEAAVAVTLTVTGPTPALAVVGRFSTDTAYVGTAVLRVDSARVVPGDAAAAWTATAGVATAAGHLFLRLPSGTGFAYRRGTAVQGTGPGWIVYGRSGGASPSPRALVDSLVVIGAGGARVLIVDTLRIADVPTLGLARAGGADSLATGGARRDSVRVLAHGPAGPIRWAAFGTGRVLQVDFAATGGGILGDGVLRFTRRTGTRPAGMYVDTVTVYPRDDASAGAIRYVDTTTVTAATALTVALSAASRRAVVVRGGEQALDSVFVSLAGPGAPAATWTATSARRTAVAVGRGSPTAETGSGWFRWSRALDALPDGLVVDTITLAVAGAAPAQIVDSVTVERVLGLTAPLRSGARAVATLTADGADSIAVRVDGRGAAAFPWRAATGAPWLVLGAAAGTGPGTLRFTRRVTALPVGVHTDSIVVVGGDPAAPSVRWVVRDSVEVLALPTVDNAARDLLGGTPMTDVERLALDGAGNKDGTYNLGDVMAHADRMRAPVSAALLEQLLAAPTSAPVSAASPPTRTPSGAAPPARRPSTPVPPHAP